MWEELTLALCTVGFLCGMSMFGAGLSGVLLHDAHWMPRSFR